MSQNATESGSQRKRRVAFIRASQGVGIPLRRIKAALDLLPENRTPTRRDWGRQSTAWRDDLNDHIGQLEHLRDRLTGCIGCGCLSLQGCKLINPDDVLGRQGSGARKL